MGLLARTASTGPGSISSTSRYRKSKALRAWFRVEAATFRSTARWVRKAAISRMSFVVEQDVTPDPTNVGLFGADRVVFDPHHITYLIQ